MVDLQDRLSREIFSRRFAELTETQQTFVEYHVGWYNAYTRKAAASLRAALQRNLKKEYDTILDMYCLRLPVEYFLDAVTEGVKKAKEREAATYSVGWFNDHFRRQSERYRKQAAAHTWGRIDVDIDYPWFFNIFRYTRENDTEFIFDPFWGFQEKKRKKKSEKGNPQKLQYAIEKQKEWEAMLQKALERTGIDKKTKVRYRDKLKRIKIKLKRMQQQLDKVKDTMEG